MKKRIWYTAILSLCLIVAGTFAFKWNAQREMSAENRGPAGLVTSLFIPPSGILLVAAGGIQIGNYGNIAPEEGHYKAVERMWLGIGLVILDDNRDKMMVFQSLDWKAAKKHDLSKREWRAYNDELALINLINDDLTKQSRQKKMSAEELREAYKKLADDVALSDPAQRAVTKLVDNMIKKVNEEIKKRES